MIYRTETPIIGYDITEIMDCNYIDTDKQNDKIKNAKLRKDKKYYENYYASFMFTIPLLW